MSGCGKSVRKRCEGCCPVFYYRIVKLFTGAGGPKTAILEGKLKNLNGTLPRGTKVEMSNEAAVIQLWSSERKTALNTRTVTEVVGADQNPRRESTVKGKVLDQTLGEHQEEKSYFHRR